MLGAEAATQGTTTQGTVEQSEPAGGVPSEPGPQASPAQRGTISRPTGVPGLDIHRVRSVWLGEFTVRQADLTLDTGARVDLDRLVASGPARWALVNLAADPEDSHRAERMVAAARSASDPQAEPGPLHLCALEIDGARLLGSLLVLFEPWPVRRPAYLLTPDLAAADLLAAHRSRAGRALVSALRPEGDPGGAAGLRTRSEAAVALASSWLTVPGARPGGPVAPDRAIVRVEPKPLPVGVRAGQAAATGTGRLAGGLGRAAAQGLSWSAGRLRAAVLPRAWR